MRRTQRSAEAASYRALYKTKEWRALRAAHLYREPLCRMCGEHGRVTPATVCDHIRPHRGDPALFFDPGNLQSLCASHHDGAKQSEERTGKVRGCDVSGFPLDPKHHWRRG